MLTLEVSISSSTLSFREYCLQQFGSKEGKQSDSSLLNSEPMLMIDLNYSMISSPVRQELSSYRRIAGEDAGLIERFVLAELKNFDSVRLRKCR
jgi:hypothetical protein